MIEVKAVGLDLKDGHAKQAVDYAANQGIEWVVLTNGSIWRIYRVIFAQPIAQEVVFECDLLSLNIKNRTQVEALFLLSKEAQNKSVLHEYHTQRQAMSRFFLGAMILSDPVIEIIRRELRRVSPGVKIESEEIRSSILTEVLKREVVEGDKFEDARKKIGRAQTRALRVRAARANGAETEVEFAGSEAETPDIVAATEE